jgi:hypothetical protein
VGDVRGIGMLAAVELVADRDSKAPFPRAAKVVETLVKACLAHGLVVWPNVGHADGHNGDLVMIAPPFNITLGEIDELTESLRSALAVTANSISVVPTFTVGRPTIKVGTTKLSSKRTS